MARKTEPGEAHQANRGQHLRRNKPSLPSKIDSGIITGQTPSATVGALHLASYRWLQRAIGNQGLQGLLGIHSQGGGSALPNLTRPKSAESSGPIVQRHVVSGYESNADYLVHLNSLQGEALLGERRRRFGEYLQDVVEATARWIVEDRNAWMGEAFQNVIRPWADAIENLCTARNAQITAGTATIQNISSVGSLLLGYVPLAGPVLSKIFELGMTSLIGRPLSFNSDSLMATIDDSFDSVGVTDVASERARFERSARDQIIHQIPNADFVRLIEDHTANTLRSVLGIPALNRSVLEARIQDSYEIRRYIARLAENILTDVEQNFFVANGEILSEELRNRQPQRAGAHDASGVSTLTFDGLNWRVYIHSFNPTGSVRDVGETREEWTRYDLLTGEARDVQGFARFSEAYLLATGMHPDYGDLQVRGFGLPTRAVFPRPLAAMVRLIRRNESGQSAVWAQTRACFQTVCEAVAPIVTETNYYATASQLLNQERLSSQNRDLLISALSDGAFRMIELELDETGGADSPEGPGRLVIRVDGEITPVSTESYRVLVALVRSHVNL